MNTRIFPVLAILALAVVEGCAWQRVGQAPDYQEKTIPLRVGIDIDNAPTSTTYGPAVVQRLRDWKVFKEIIYPHRDGDDVDAILKISIAGNWDPETGKNIARGVVVGLSLFTLSPVFGSGMLGRHNLDSDFLTNTGQRVSHYTVHAESSAAWGLGADSNEVGRKADRLQVGRLAKGLADKLYADWPNSAKNFAAPSNSSGTSAKVVAVPSKPISQPTSPNPAPSSVSSSGAQLRELKNLRDEGVLTEEEYQKKKKSILDKM